MINEDESIDSSPTSWLWSDCKLVLRRTNPLNPSEESYQNLQAQVELECQQISEPFIPILTFQQPFSRDSCSLSYFWKRGSPLPTLTVKLQESYFNLLKQDQQLEEIYCELTIAYPNRKQTHFYLQQVRAIGTKRQQFSDQGIAKFNDILLKQCSVQKGNNKFSLLVRICASSPDQSKITLKTLISTAFLVMNSRIKRTIKKKKLFIKLVSPKKFLQPLTHLEAFKQNLTPQSVLNFLRNFCQSIRYLSNTHPLHIIYHYSDFLRLHYNSKEVTDLYELLEKIAPKIGQSDNFDDLKKSSLKYELKKTKNLKKKAQKLDNKIRKKLQFIIKTSKNKEMNPENRLLLVTFNQQLIQKINTIIDEQKSQHYQSSFEIQFNKEVQNLSKIFTQWSNFCIEIDLLKEQPESVYWKDIHREKVYEAYSKHYQVTKNRFFNTEKNMTKVLNHHSNDNQNEQLY